MACESSASKESKHIKSTTFSEYFHSADKGKLYSFHYLKQHLQRIKFHLYWIEDFLKINTRKQFINRFKINTMKSDEI